MYDVKAVQAVKACPDTKHEFFPQPVETQKQLGLAPWAFCEALRLVLG